MALVCPVVVGNGHDNHVPAPVFVCDLQVVRQLMDVRQQQAAQAGTGGRAAAAGGAGTGGRAVAASGAGTGGRAVAASGAGTGGRAVAGGMLFVRQN